MSKIAVLAGDGVGPEVMDEALRVLDALALARGKKFEFRAGLIGGAAYDKHQCHCPEETLSLCRGSDAILFGSVGGPVAQANEPKWNRCEANSVLTLRKEFSFNVNLRPVRVVPELRSCSPLRADLLSDGIDLLIVRELLGDVYFGEHKLEVVGGKRRATDVAQYTEDQIRSVAVSAFSAAKARRRRLTSIDKANVLETSRLWREIVKEVAAEYPEVTYSNMLVDNCAMQLILKPAQFDVLLTPNLFGDILSDEAAVLAGSLGLLASASLNRDGFGLYEPPGGSAPDIAGKGIANPIGQILSAAMMLRYTLNSESDAAVVEEAVRRVLRGGARTADIAAAGERSMSTREMGEAILTELRSVVG